MKIQDKLSIKSRFKINDRFYWGKEYEVTRLNEQSISCESVDEVGTETAIKHKIPFCALDFYGDKVEITG